ncbi:MULTISPECIES: hypothetical protein [unclassified Streptomyces]|uniref:hypothetical protein n=1 Tax=unclassified Streptomyces TaxID=2593676 RepID=UPI0003730C97|nr:MULTISPECIES: hypothetical protein [unclassified Streptomyces]MYT31334.1 hypothetical protein [Streptomyces sp. SID8354]
MTYRRAAIPVLVGGLLLLALVWWAGASAPALDLPGTTNVISSPAVGELTRWLTPWSYDVPVSAQLGNEAFGGAGATASLDGLNYVKLHTTAQQIRYVALFVFFVVGALLLIRRLPPAKGRTTAALLAVWTWGLVAGMLAVTVSAPWMIASGGHGSFRFLPELSNIITTGREVVLMAALVAAVATVLLARIAGAGPVRRRGHGQEREHKREQEQWAEEQGQLPSTAVPARAARLAATVGTVVIALSLFVLSYTPVAAVIQSISPRTGLVSEPGDLLRQWLLLGGWDWPGGGPLGEWLLYRAIDAVLLAVVWWSLRRLPGLLTRATVPAMAVTTVCATVLGLLVSQLLRMLINAESLGGDPLRLVTGLGVGTPAALTCGLVAGIAAAVTLRTAGGRAARADATPSAQDDPACS